jgi:hypothetical protein
MTATLRITRSAMLDRPIDRAGRCGALHDAGSSGMAGGVAR